MKFGVVVFPGSNCDADAYHAFKDALGQPTTYLWHKDHDLRGVDCVVLPGGFSYGDYLRSGAIARFSPLMQEVREFADKGGLVIGICNGFQVLLELNLLPGAMLRNKKLKFLCQYVTIRIENDRTRFTHRGTKGRILHIPIAHFDGNWYAPPETLQDVEDGGQVVFRYCDPSGALTEESNVNGSLHSIAGLINKRGNVMGMMPHPERSVEPILGSVDGLVILQSMIERLS